MNLNNNNSISGPNSNSYRKNSKQNSKKSLYSLVNPVNYGSSSSNLNNNSCSKEGIFLYNPENANNKYVNEFNNNDNFINTCTGAQILTEDGGDKNISGNNIYTHKLNSKSLVSTNIPNSASNSHIYTNSNKPFNGFFYGSSPNNNGNKSINISKGSKISNNSRFKVEDEHSKNSIKKKIENTRISFPHSSKDNNSSSNIKNFTPGFGGGSFEVEFKKLRYKNLDQKHNNAISGNIVLNLDNESEGRVSLQSLNDSKIMEIAGKYVNNNENGQTKVKENYRLSSSIYNKYSSSSRVNKKNTGNIAKNDLRKSRK